MAWRKRTRFTRCSRCLWNAALMLVALAVVAVLLLGKPHFGPQAPKDRLGVTPAADATPR